MGAVPQTDFKNFQTAAAGPRVVFDTCVLLSALGVHGQRAQYPAKQAFDYVSRHGQLILSPQTRREVVYRGLHEDVAAEVGDAARKMVQFVCRFANLVNPTQDFRHCAHMADNKWLNAAVAGRANYLLTEDKALLEWQQINFCTITTPRAFARKHRLES